MSAERFKSKITINGAGCWIWQGAVVNKKSKTLIPAVKFNGKQTNARRASFEIFIGEILEENLMVIANCNEAMCVNPEHLELVHKSQSVGLLIGAKASSENAKTLKFFKCGHTVSEENLLMKKGGRSCLTCHREYNREWKRNMGKRA